MEIFKDIVGYEGLYQVSNKGNIKTLVSRYKGIDILTPGITTAGYKIVTLCKNKKRETVTIHRAVCIAFLGNKNLCVNHKDGDKTNNNLENLEWVTYKENTQHAMKNGLIKFNTTKIAEDKRKQIAQLELKTNKLIKIFESSHEASRLTGINRGNICSCARGVANTAGNYKWEYVL